MSDFKKGDKVRLNDKGFLVLPKSCSRQETEALLGVLTVSMVLPCPIMEDPNGQAIWMEEVGSVFPSVGVERV